MDVARLPHIGLPIPSACFLPPRFRAGAASLSSKPRTFALQASLQISCGGGAKPTSDRITSSWIAGTCLKGSNLLARRVGFCPKQKPSHLHSCRRQRGSRCELAAHAAVSEASNPDWNGTFTSPSESAFWQRARAFCFYMTTYIVALPLFVIMLFVHPFVLLFDKHKRKAQHAINKVWAALTIYPFYKTEIEGLENLPGPDEPAVYVSNHQSFLDIYTLFLLERPFKFISKTSNFLIPLIGWSMYLTGHVPLRRMDRKSQIECLRHCRNLIKQGVPVFFFPEGTRSRDGKMAHFKKGAFTIAAKMNVPVIPVSLIGTGKLMPNGKEGTLKPGLVKVVIHPPIQGNDPDELCKISRAVIAESLLKHGLEVL